MKKLINSKLLLQVFVASVAAILATVGIVTATTTTIGADITTTGNLTVDTTTFYVGSTANRVGVGTTTPLASFSINNEAGENAFVIGSSTATWLKVDASGLLSVAKGATFSDTLAVSGASTFTGAIGFGTASSSAGGASMLKSANISSDTGAISFGANSLSTSGTLALTSGALSFVNASSTGTLKAYVISSDNPGISFNSKNLTTIGDVGMVTASSTSLVKVNSLKVSAVGTTLSGVLFGTCTYDPASINIATSSSAVTTGCSATGVTSAYKVFVTPPADFDSGDNWLLFKGATASTTNDYIEISLFNASTTAAVNGPSKTWSWMAIK
jgi:hypothetical protein